MAWDWVLGLDLDMLVEAPLEGFRTPGAACTDRAVGILSMAVQHAVRALSGHDYGQPLHLQGGVAEAPAAEKYGSRQTVSTARGFCRAVAPSFCGSLASCLVLSSLVWSSLGCSFLVTRGPNLEMGEERNSARKDAKDNVSLYLHLSPARKTKRKNSSHFCSKVSHHLYRSLMLQDNLCGRLRRKMDFLKPQ